MVGKTALGNLQNLHACAKLVYVMSQVTSNNKCTCVLATVAVGRALASYPGYSILCVDDNWM